MQLHSSRNQNVPVCGQHGGTPSLVSEQCISACSKLWSTCPQTLPRPHLSGTSPLPLPSTSRTLLTSLSFCPSSRAPPLSSPGLGYTERSSPFDKGPVPERVLSLSSAAAHQCWLTGWPRRLLYLSLPCDPFKLYSASDIIHLG